MNRLDQIRQHMINLEQIQLESRELMVDTGDVDIEIYNRALETWKSNPLLHFPNDATVTPVPNMGDMKLLLDVVEGLQEELNKEYGWEYGCPICKGNGYDTPAIPPKGNPKYADDEEFVKVWVEWSKEHPDQAFLMLRPGTSGGYGDFRLPPGARVPEHIRYSPGRDAIPGHEAWCPLGILLKEVEG